jgi:gamma-glutamylcyclotransferase (GGCT)/AIG2-like uncharacterized protein YtfP
MSHIVAVYGTLRRGLYNNYLLEGARFIANAETVDNCTMYSRGGFPILSFHDGDGPVKVELYEVNDHTLANLDRLEGYRGEGSQGNWYNRTHKVFLREGDENDELHVSAYIYHQDQPQSYPVVEGGDWVKYRGRAF